MAASSPPEPPPWRQGALVLGAALGLAAGYSAAYFGTLSVFLKAIAEGFGWTRAATSGVAVLAQAGIAAGAPLVGLLIDRHGARSVVGASIVLFALALLLLTVLPPSLALFGAASVLVGLVSVATTPVGYLLVLTRAFDRRLGLALGLAMLGLGLGTVLMPLLAQRWVAAAGWQGAYRGLALTVLAMGALALLLIFGVGRGGAPAAAVQAGPRAVVGDSVGDGFRAGVRSGRFWLIAAVFFGVAAAGLGAVVHIVPMLSDRGVSATEAAAGASLVGIGVMAGRFGAGAALDHLHARHVAALAFALGGAGLAVLALLALDPNASMAMAAGGAMLVGLAIGAEGDFLPYFVRRYFGTRDLGLFYGVLLSIYSLGGVVGPVLYGFAFDRLESYAGALGIGCVACLSCAAGVLLVGPYRHAAARRA